MGSQKSRTKPVNVNVPVGLSDSGENSKTGVSGRELVISKTLGEIKPFFIEEKQTPLYQSGSKLHALQGLRHFLQEIWSAIQAGGFAAPGIAFKGAAGYTDPDSRRTCGRVARAFKPGGNR